MTQPPERPAEQEPPAGGATQFTPPDPAPPPSAPPPAPPYQPYPQPYAAAPPIGEAYGPPAPPGGRGVYAPRWRRLLAAILDNVILSIVANLVSTLVGAGTTFSSDGPGKQFAASGIALVLGAIYYIWQHGRWGRTIGKRALDIRVVRADDGGAISYGTAAWRIIFSYVLTFTLIGWIIDNAWILFDQRRQALHDKVARTIVVQPPIGDPDPYAQR